MLFKLRHMTLVAFSANVGCVFLIRDNRALRRQRVPRLEQSVKGALNGLLAFAVFGFQPGIGARDWHKGNHFNNLEKVIESDNGIVHHKKRFRDAQHILERPGSLGLKILDTIISHVTDCPTNEGWQD